MATYPSTLDLLALRYTVEMSIPEVAEATKFRDQTIRNQLSIGTFPIPSHKSGRRRLFHIADVAAYIDCQAGFAVDVYSRRRGRPTKAEQVRREGAGT